MEMKTLTLIIALCITSAAFGVTREVSLDGLYQYTSIQSAIDASIDGDIVQVHPGEYFEHLNTNGRSITIQSMYPTTQLEETINNTIIHSTPQYSCLKVNNSETISINGFTLMNNYPVNLGVNLYSAILLVGVSTYITNPAFKFSIV